MVKNQDQVKRIRSQKLLLVSQQVQIVVLSVKHEKFVAGRLKNFIFESKKISSDYNTLEIAQGCCIEFTDLFKMINLSEN